jgi:hypothetical protein
MKGTHAKYGGFAYSSEYAYSVPPGLFTLEQYALASQLGLSDDGGEYWKTRRLCEYAAIEDRAGGPVLVSVWKPFPDVTIKTFLVPPVEGETPYWHLRAHRIEAGREVQTADGAFAIRNVNSVDGRYLEPYDAARGEGTSPRIIGNYDLNTPDGWATGRAGAFAVSRGAVGIKALEGTVTDAGVASLPTERGANLVNADPNSNLVESRTTIPTLQHTIRKGETAWYVTGVYARPPAPGVAPQAYLDGWDTPPAVPAWLVAEMAT